MTKARDRADRTGSDPIRVGNTVLETDSNNDLVVKDTSNANKKVIASEVHLGTGTDKVILKRSSTDGKLQLQTTDGSTTSNSEVSGDSGGSGGVTVQEEGSDLSTTATTLNFVGSAVTASGSGSTKTITISAGSGGTTSVYANIAAMTATSPSAGDQALVTANSGLYVYNGNGWYKVATVNTSPTISSPATGGSFVLALDGTATTIELVGADVDEGTTLQHSYAVTTGSLTNGGGATATITTSSTSNGTYTALNPSTNTTNRFFKVTPTTNSSYAGSFTITFSVSDTINAATTVQSFSLEFSSYGSAYFDGTGDYLSIPHSASFYDLGTADWTIECWVYFTDTSVFNGLFQLGKNVGSLSTMLYTDGKLKLLENDQSVVFESNTTFVANEWYHIAFTNNDSTNTQKLYVNGVQESNTGSKSTAFQFTEKTVFIGGRWFSNAFQRPMNGYISNFRIVGGSEVYTSNFTKPTEPLAVINNTKLLTANKNNEIVDTSSFAYNIATNGNVTHHVKNPFPWHTTGYGSLYFDGSGDSLTTQTSSNLQLGSGDFTVEYWINTNNFNSTGNIFDGRDVGSNNSFITNTNTSGQHRLWYPGGYRITSTAMSANTWYHIAIVRNSGVITMYLDGTAQSTTWSTSTNFTGQKVTLGTEVDGVSSEFNGYISNVRVVVGTAVYTSNFTPFTTPLTAITNTKLLTAQRSVPASVANGSTYFDGSGDYIDTTNPLSGTGDFTMEGWIYPTTSGSYDGYFSTCLDTGADGGIVVAKDKFFVTHGGGSSQIGFSDTIENNAWYHIVLQRSSNVFSLYLNGVLQGTATATASLTGSTLRLASRYNNNTTHQLTGYISNFRIVAGSTVYASTGFTPPNSALTAITYTQLLTSQNSTGSITDASSNGYTITANGNATASTFAPTKIAIDQSTSNFRLIPNGNTRNATSWPFNYNG